MGFAFGREVESVEALLQGGVSSGIEEWIDGDGGGSARSAEQPRKGQ